MLYTDRHRFQTLLTIACLLMSAASASVRAEMPGDCADMLDADDAFEFAMPASRDDTSFFDYYVGEFHSDRLEFDDEETEYYFALRYDWFDQAKSTLEYSVTMVIPEQDREVPRSEGFYGYDPFEARIIAVGAFRQFGVTLAVLEHSDPDAGTRRMLGRVQRPDGAVTLISDQFEIVDEDTFHNRAFACTTATREWAQVYEGTYTRQPEAADDDAA